MTRQSKVQTKGLDEAESEFFPLLLSCLRACSEGRWGLFGQNDHLEDGRWPEAIHLKKLAQQIRSIRHETGERNEVCERFLYLCSLRGPNIQGEPKLAAALLAEIGR